MEYVNIHLFEQNSTHFLINKFNRDYCLTADWGSAKEKTWTIEKVSNQKG